MKKRFSLIILLFFICGCGTNEEEMKISLDKFTDNSRTYSIDNFLSSGFKINREYDVSELENADGVWYGFWKNDVGKALDFEIRIYPTHKIALDSGISYVDEVIGEDAILKKSLSSWNEGIQDRRTRSDKSYTGSSANTVRAKYLDYIIYGNTIILCTGLDLTYARQNCSELALSIEK
ncbi:MAG: DUF6810 family protein [Chloroflexota bacterium]|nr:DUF6810 family protein [Chloroflexota bacterium]|tara:strand:+ start:1232 stop:1765 length:534 start_codon:yes stop_codon:yes gene_type:complete